VVAQALQIFRKMKRISLSFLILFAAVLNAPVLAQEQAPPKSTSRVNVRFDKGKNLSTISLKSMTITRLDQEKRGAGDRDFPLHQMDIEGNFTFAGQFIGGEVKDAKLIFHAVASNYIFLKAQDVTVAIDRDKAEKARAFSLGMTSYRSMPPKFGSVYEEYFELAIPIDAIRKFAAAEQLEFFLGPVTYTLTPKQLDAIKEWSKFLPAIPA
jgi:hypothetical protein